MARTALRLVLAVSAATTLATAASAENFFTALFGGGQPREGRSAYERDTGTRSGLFGWGAPQPAPDAMLDPNDPGLRQEMTRHRRPSAPIEGAGTSGKQKAIEATAEAPTGSLAMFEKDKTLRAGDVVVTTRGFMVYEGGDRHEARSFAAVSGSSAGKTARVSLAALERASRMSTPNVTYTNTVVHRDFIGPRLPDQVEARADVGR